MPAKRPFRIFLVNDEGVRAKESVMAIAGEISLADVRLYAQRNFERFVILDTNNVQLYASDKRDDTGAYIPW